jgi:hypothetical protein
VTLSDLAGFLVRFVGGHRRDTELLHLRVERQFETADVTAVQHVDTRFCLMLTVPNLTLARRTAPRHGSPLGQEQNMKAIGTCSTVRSQFRYSCGYGPRSWWRDTSEALLCAFPRLRPRGQSESRPASRTKLNIKTTCLDLSVSFSWVCQTKEPGNPGPFRLWCGRGDSNPHALASASPSSWCVCQFRHFRVEERSRRTARLKADTTNPDLTSAAASSVAASQASPEQPAPA